MIKILHSADWHLDAPMRGFTDAQRKFLRRKMLSLPDTIADLAIREGCDLMLLSGDLFDGPYTPESFHAVSRALERVGIPVFISPGNHDFYSTESPWIRENWPKNVHIFTRQEISSVSVPGLSCRVYGAAFTGMDCPGLLDSFRADCAEQYAVMTLHGDATSANSPYCPVTAAQVRESGLDYLALGHIHAAGRLGDRCAWPGCPMGHGYDETGVKGVLLAELGGSVHVRFVPLDTPRFYDLSVTAGDDPFRAVSGVLTGRFQDFYRIRVTGEASADAMNGLSEKLETYPNLTLLDETVPPVDLWGCAQSDSLEGVYFGILHDAMDGQDDQTRRALELAARISRQILQGREVELP